ncbi:MAG: hypothetical protein AAB368_15050, partial [bacterium]
MAGNQTLLYAGLGIGAWLLLRSRPAQAGAFTPADWAAQARADYARRLQAGESAAASNTLRWLLGALPVGAVVTGTLGLLKTGIGKVLGLGSEGAAQTALIAFGSQGRGEAVEAAYQAYRAWERDLGVPPVEPIDPLPLQTTPPEWDAFWEPVLDYPVPGVEPPLIPEFPELSYPVVEPPADLPFAYDRLIFDEATQLFVDPVTGWSGPWPGEVDVVFPPPTFYDPPVYDLGYPVPGVEPPPDLWLDPWYPVPTERAETEIGLPPTPGVKTLIEDFFTMGFSQEQWDAAARGIEALVAGEVPGLPLGGGDLIVNGLPTSRDTHAAAPRIIAEQGFSAAAYSASPELLLLGTAAGQAPLAAAGGWGVSLAGVFKVAGVIG